jgi:outer membrane protein assembly factor BamB
MAKTSRKTKTKQKIAIQTAIVLALALTIALPSIAITPTAAADLYPTVARISVTPNTVGLGQSVLINAWTSPQPPLIAAGTTQGRPRTDYMLTFTSPDGTTDTKGPYTSDGPGTMWMTYTPNNLGVWSVKFSWPGDEIYAGSETTVQFTVQEQEISSWPEAALPTGYWERPISAENREWYSLSGSWLQTVSGGHRGGYNASVSDFNPYSKGPSTAHILWKNFPIGGGLIGGVTDVWTGAGIGEGEAWSESFNGQYSDVLQIIVAGKVYYLYQNQIHCLDLKTGEELWVKAASGESSLYGQLAPRPYLLSFGSNFNRYDAATGNRILSINGSMSATVFEDPYVYSIVGNNLIKWTTGPVEVPPDLTRPNWDVAMDKRIIYNVTLRDADHPFSISYVWNDIGVGSYTRFGAGATVADSPIISAVNLTTGELMWNVSTGPMGYVGPGGVVGYGKYFYNNYLDMKWHAVDLYTGEEVWTSDPAVSPWGTWWAYASAVAYDKVYASCYDGHIYAYDVNSGRTVWNFSSGNSGTETPFGTWPFWGPPVVADGKVYASTGEHSPTNPMTRGYRLYCLDAETGQPLWSIAFGGQESKTIADGALVATNVYDNGLYCFDKGQTSMTVSVTKSQINKGESIGITGTILDQSPAQPGTPCVSADSMTGWMEYLHMDRPKPTNTTGVQVTLTAIKSDGTVVNIGSATSDADGVFRMQWTPTDQDLYKITATFDGDGSYWGSKATSALMVGSASAAQPAASSSASSAAPSVPVAPTEGLSTSTTLVVAAAVIVIIAVALSAFALRRHSKKD